MEKRSNSCCWWYSKFSIVKPDCWKDVIFLCDGWSYVVFLRRFTATLAISREPRVRKIDQFFPRPVKPLSHTPTHPATLKSCCCQQYPLSLFNKSARRANKLATDRQINPSPEKRKHFVPSAKMVWHDEDKKELFITSLTQNHSKWLFPCSYTSSFQFTVQLSFLITWQHLLLRNRHVTLFVLRLLVLTWCRLGTVYVILCPIIWYWSFSVLKHGEMIRGIFSFGTLHWSWSAWCSIPSVPQKTTQPSETVWLKISLNMQEINLSL